MDKREDGGPAFPTETIGFHCPQPGMSLRDWFAGQALVCMLSDPTRKGDRAHYASDVYGYADAMLQERAK